MLGPYPVDNSTGVVRFSNIRSTGIYYVVIANSSHARLTWTRNNDSAVLDDAWVVRPRG